MLTSRFVGRQVMMTVGEIIIDYDHDKKVGALGFGATLPNNPGEASHCFALSGSPAQVGDLGERERNGCMDGR
jgi:hypothetical protein